MTNKETNELGGASSGRTSRREFLGYSAAGVGALLAGTLAAPYVARAQAPQDFVVNIWGARGISHVDAVYEYVEILKQRTAGMLNVKLLPLSVKERFLAWTPGERFAFTMEAITLPLVSQLMEEWRLTADGAGTVVEWTVCYRPTLLTRALHPLVRAIFDGMFKASLRGLDTYLRSRGA